MKKNILLILGLIASFAIGMYTNPIVAKQQAEEKLKLGAFSMSLSVKDLKASKEFYEELGFVVSGGAMEKRYLIMKNETTLIGLFQGFFKSNMLTFNPGWDVNAKNVDPFDDVRKIQRSLKSHGRQLLTEANESTTGPASCMVTDPDGNIILIDQHR